MIDFNENGLPDFWEARLKLPATLQPDADDDGDGFTNLEESVFGSDPLVAGNVETILKVERGESGEVALSWGSIRGKSYFLERRIIAAGEDWEVATDLFEGNDGILRYTPSDDESATSLWRFKVKDDDADFDGLTSREEYLLRLSDQSNRSGWDPYNTDYINALEILHGGGVVRLADGSIYEESENSMAQASYLLSQATFGAPYEEIESVASSGLVAWVDRQMATPVTKSRNLLYTQDQPIDYHLWRRTWWQLAFTAEDQLYQRAAFALSQIFVISTESNSEIRGSHEGQAIYYDKLIEIVESGSHRDALEFITYSPLMGIYLSSLKNRMADPEIGRFPDENFAREIMQVFSIGLWELNLDGTRMKEFNGEDIPTYGNDDIFEMAKIFTGGNWGGAHNLDFFAANKNYLEPMIFWDEQHSKGPKFLANGVTVPDGQSADEDIADALDMLANHPSAGPFFCRLLIQRLTSSNPSPEYIRRVVEVYEDDGFGNRGMIAPVVRSILLDPEARSKFNNRIAGGTKVREPFLRYVALARSFNAEASSGRYVPATLYASSELGQAPLRAPSVFNFYSPDFQPFGPLRDEGLYSPELELATASRVLQTENIIESVIDRGLDPFTMPEEDVLHLDLSDELALAGDVDQLLDRLDILLTHGSLSPDSRAAIRAALILEEDLDKRTRDAIYLIITSPDYVCQQ
ncbi:DUF1800 domain-containing protein [bacterium]|nr:DUF1800 domain-containing protein [bacterium]